MKDLNFLRPAFLGVLISEVQLPKIWSLAENSSCQAYVGSANPTFELNMENCSQFSVEQRLLKPCWWIIIVGFWNISILGLIRVIILSYPVCSGHREWLPTSAMSQWWKVFHRRDLPDVFAATCWKTHQQIGKKPSATTMLSWKLIRNLSQW